MTGVRSAVITLQREPSPLRFVLFPMVHLGSAAFYQDVTARLRDCQLIVAEGIKGPSVVARALTLSYRLPGHSHRMKLTVQDIDYLSLTGQETSPAAGTTEPASKAVQRTDRAGTPADSTHTSSGPAVICPDMTGRQFGRLWGSLPTVQRMAAWLVIPVVALVVWLVGTRRFLARHMGRTDLPTVGDHVLREKFPKFMELIIDARDTLLLRSLVAIHEQRGAEPIKVAVVYGADHMPAVVRELWARYGYRPRTAEWLTVFDF